MFKQILGQARLVPKSSLRFSKIGWNAFRRNDLPCARLRFLLAACATMCTLTDATFLICGRCSGKLVPDVPRAYSGGKADRLEGWQRQRRIKQCLEPMLHLGKHCLRSTRMGCPGDVRSD